MFNRVANWLLQTLVVSIAAAIRMVHINRVTFRSVDNREFVFKERHRLSWLLILPGNVVLRWRQVPVRVLNTNQWQTWERAIVPCDQVCKAVSGRTLVIAKIAGSPLAQVLANDYLSIQLKLEAVSLAASALANFHQRDCETLEHGRIKLSHGDATVRNVMMEVESKNATWFDFDLRHDLSVAPADRHADDLRAFLFSAAQYFEPDQLADLVRVAKREYVRSEVWQRLSQQLNSRWFCVDLFHFAHTRPPTSARLKVASNGSCHDRTIAFAKAIRSVMPPDNT